MDAVERNELVKEAERKAFLKLVTNMYYSYYTDSISNQTALDKIPGYYQIPLDVQRHYESTISKHDAKTPYMFITVSPRDDVGINALCQKVTKFVNQKWIKQYVYAYEQRSVIPNEYSGYHVHILIQRDGESFQHSLRRIQNTFKQIAEPQCINIQYRIIEHVKRTYDYICGIKKDDTKQDKIDNDKRFREYYGLQNLYKSQVFTLDRLGDEKPAVA